MLLPDIDLGNSENSFAIAICALQLLELFTCQQECFQGCLVLATRKLGLSLSQNRSGYQEGFLGGVSLLSGCREAFFGLCKSPSINKICPCISKIAGEI